MYILVRVVWVISEKLYKKRAAGKNKQINNLIKAFLNKVFLSKFIHQPCEVYITTNTTFLRRKKDLFQSRRAWEYCFFPCLDIQIDGMFSSRLQSEKLIGSTGILVLISPIRKI